MRCAAIHGKQNLAADHELSQVVLVRLRWLARPNNPAVPDNSDSVGDFQHLIEFVADEDDTVALSGQSAEDCEDFHRLLRREHCRGLVEYEDPRLAVKSF